ncbi:MAG: stage II sporulation protein M [Methanomicrobiales archaeon HGW-Methanomicrobiales-4]|nr:MAG: stage II sporulation protein M [Methanomicrobiales archaeon HGW-Methanomicrobiales-4]
MSDPIQPPGSDNEHLPNTEGKSILMIISPFQREFIRYFGISVLIFIIGSAGGYFTSLADPAFGQSLVTLFQDMITNEIMSNEPPLLAIQLFLNNLEACVLLFIGGATFGIITLFVLSFNGIIIGGILEVVGAKTGGLVMIAAIVPHGIFELPAVLVSASLGLMLGRAVMLELLGKGDASAQALVLGRLFVRYVIPFIAFAACIEAFITPAVLHLVA